MDLLNRMPLSAKISLGTKVMGLTRKDTSALDDFISSMSDHPAVATLLGKQLRGIDDLVAYATNEGSGFISEYKNLVVKALHDDQMRSHVGTVLSTCLPKDKGKRDELITIMMKVVNSPFGSDVPDSYDSTDDIISKGLLPMVAQHLPLPESEGPPRIVVCRYCHEPFQI